MKVLILGASGFIGTRLTNHLFARGDEVTAVDIVPPRERLPNVKYVQADVRQVLPESLGEGIDVIFNLAAVHRTPGHRASEYYETNILGACQATRLADRCHVNTIVFTSSISVYGPCEQRITEESELRPVSDYGRSKMMAEVIHREWRSSTDGRRLVIVRPGVVFGPGERGNYTHLAHALRRGLFVYPGRSDTVKSGGHVDELLRTIDFALSHPADEVLYNFAFPNESTTRDIVAAFCSVAGVSSRAATAPLPILMFAAGVFEAAAKFGLKTPIHRERVLKLVQSTRIAPEWLKRNNYVFNLDLERALRSWRDETAGAFN